MNEPIKQLDKAVNINLIKYFVLGGGVNRVSQKNLDENIKIKENQKNVIEDEKNKCSSEFVDNFKFRIGELEWEAWMRVLDSSVK